MRLLVLVALGLASLLVVGILSPDAQELTQTDRQGPVSVAVTLAAPPALGAPLRAKVALDTHSVGLDGIAFDKLVALRGPDGVESAPTTVEAKGSGHHREATLTFAPITKPGSVAIVVKEVGGIAERTFAWELR